MTIVTIAQGNLKGGKATTQSGFNYYEFLGIPYAKPPVGELRFKTVRITQGELKGGQATTESGFNYYEFLGIPYAKPPVGELRFKSPLSPDPWEGTRDATAIDSTTVAYQVDMLRTGKIIGTEDCLYLNVYTPQLPSSDLKLKPVMVYIHGGGFIGGNGTNKEDNGPDYLIENDVVIVTLNYRVGLLGFLCLDIPEAAGNMGLKDNIKALQWVQNNIEKFGGDKNNITIFGISAGSAACEFLMLSPLAKGLFHKCILQSGSSLNHWTMNYNETPQTLALKVAQELGYTGPYHDYQAVYKVLFEASASELIRLASKIADKHVSNRVLFGFVPVIERDFGNGDAFLTDHPYTILKEGSYNHVPVIRGFCNIEGILTSFFKPNVFKRLITTKSFVDSWAFKFDDSDITKYNSKLVNAYFKNANNGDESDDFALKFFGDLDFNAGIQLAGKLQCTKIPVYMYQFCYDGNLNACKVLLTTMQPDIDIGHGAIHGDDMGYLFRHIAVASKIPNETDLLMRNRMTKMWTNFAKTSNPTPDGYSDVQWPVFTPNSKEYLNIDKEFTVKANYENEKMAIFEEIYDKYKK